MSDPHKTRMDIKHFDAKRIPLSRMYDYRRKLPHYQKPSRALFVTFRSTSHDPFPPIARNAILRCCLKGHNYKFVLHAAVVMPEHVHLLLTPLNDKSGWPYGLPDILKSLKGAAARAVNQILGRSGPVWQEESFDHVLRSDDRFEDKKEYIRQNPVRRGLVKKPEDYPWLWLEKPGLCGSDILVRQNREATKNQGLKKNAGQECPANTSKPVGQECPTPTVQSNPVGQECPTHTISY